MTIDESRFRIKPGSKVRLADYDPADTRLMPDKTKAEAAIAKEAERLEELQERLYAGHLRSLLVLLQGMDASRKEGTIKHVFNRSRNS